MPIFSSNNGFPKSFSPLKKRKARKETKKGSSLRYFSACVTWSLECKQVFVIKQRSCFYSLYAIVSSFYSQLSSYLNVRVFLKLLLVFFGVALTREYKNPCSLCFSFLHLTFRKYKKIAVEFLFDLRGKSMILAVDLEIYRNEESLTDL